MISIDEKMYITKDVSDILISYANEVVIKELLLKFCFNKSDGKTNVTELITSVGNCESDSLPPKLEMELVNFINRFVDRLPKIKINALYFWIIDQHFSDYVNDETFDISGSELKDFDNEFGKHLAYKLINPKESNLLYDLKEKIFDLLIVFASEEDFLLIDKETKRSLKKTIKYYTQR